jgi:hypothetical protein
VTTEVERLQRSEYTKEQVDQQKKLMNGKMEENFSLKQIIDQKRTDNEKQRKRLEALEDQYANRSHDLDTATRDLKEAQQQLQVRLKHETQLNGQLLQQKEQIRLLEQAKLTSDDRLIQARKQRAPVAQAESELPAGSGSARGSPWTGQGAKPV